MSTVGLAIPSYGRERHLQATLESILAQTRHADDVVVVDDCSPDGTGDVAQRYKARGIRYLRNPVNLGVPKNYNQSISQLKTDYVAIVEDHDYLMPKFIELSAQILDENPTVTVVSSYIGDMDEQTGKLLHVHKSDFQRVTPGRDLARHLVLRNGAPFGLVALIRRSALEGLEPWFDPKYWWYADVDLWIRLALKGDFGYIHEPLVWMRRREAGHFLQDKAWESFVMCERIRRDNHRAVLGTPDLNDTLALLTYAIGRDYYMLKNAVSGVAAGSRNIPSEAREIMTPGGRAAMDLALKVPAELAKAIRSLHHRLVPRA